MWQYSGKDLSPTSFKLGDTKTRAVGKAKSWVDN